MVIETNRDRGSSVLKEKKFPGPDAVASWVLGFGLVVFLGANGGGYSVDLFGQLGIFAWLLLILGAILGLFPVGRPGNQAWIGGALLVALLAWACLGLIWTDSADKTFIEIARLSTYSAIFILAIAGRGRNSLPNQIGAVGAGVVVIGGIALLSRFQPDLFPSAADTGKALTSEAARLAYPLNYWNGLGALLAIGLAPLLQVAGSGLRMPVRAVATGAVPIVVLALYFTFSRGGLLAAAIALIAFICLTTRRFDKVLVSAIGIGGGLVLVLLARARPDVREGLINPAAHQQGDEMMWLTLLVCVLTGLATWGAIRLTAGRSRPDWSRLSRKQLLAGAGTAALVLIVSLLAIGAPGKVSDGWASFKSTETPEQGSNRLSAANGNGRYQLWSSGIKQFESAPITGQGAGTFEYWWAEHGDRPGFVRDTHSLYIQALGESGLIGFLLVTGLVLFVLGSGTLRSLASRDERSSWVAPAVAGCLAFAISAALDWSWQIPAVVAGFLLLAATILTQSGAEIQRAGSSTAPAGIRPRIVLVLVAVCGIGALAVPVSAAILLDRSSDFARQGDLEAALDSARSAHGVSPSTAAPLIQEAGILEGMGEVDLAIVRARQATEAEPLNWRNWLILAGIEARDGQTDDALMNFREARRLNPRSKLLAP